MGLIVPSWVRNAWAVWSARIAIFALQLTVVTFVLHRIYVLGTPLSMALFAIAIVIANIGALAAFVALIQIWRNGGGGAIRAGFAVFTGLLALSVPLLYLPTYLALPEINDVSTDLQNPPQFNVLAGPPAGTGFLIAARAGPDGVVQQASYPELRPVFARRSVAAAFDAARHVAKRAGWRIVAEDPPKRDAQIGRIEAVDETLIMGFRDDVVIRVRSFGDQARIDVRSASRYGRHDFGRNAQRIREISRQLRARLEFDLPAELDEEEITPKKRVIKKRRVKRRVKKKRRSRRVRRKRRRPSPPKIPRAPKPTWQQRG